MRRKFGMVFQYAALLDSMTVLDNVAFPLREHTKLSEKEIRERVKAKLADLGLEDVGALSSRASSRAACASASAWRAR